MTGLKYFKVKLVLAAILSLSAVAEAKVDLTRYQLTEKQISLLERLAEKGFSDEQLDQLAQAFERSNSHKATYIPPHTDAELDAVFRWAEGGAYASFAKYANVKFDYDAYLADCPNRALFNFGRASGIEFLKIDVMGKFTNTVYSLNYRLQADPESFRTVYLEAIRSTEFARYVGEIYFY